MTLKKFQVGDPFRPSARILNAWTDAALAHQGTRTGNSRSRGHQVLGPGECWIQNDSGADRDRFEVLGLGEALISPDLEEEEFLVKPAYVGKKPQAVTNGTTHVGAWAMLLEPIAYQEIGRAIVHGTISATIDITHPWHDRVDIAHDSVAATSNWYGSAQILWPLQDPTDGRPTGEQLARIRLSNFVTAEMYGRVTETYGIAADASGDVMLLFEDQYGDDEDVATVEAKYRTITPATSLPLGTMVRTRYVRQKHRWDIIDHECV